MMDTFVLQQIALFGILPALVFLAWYLGTRSKHQQSSVAASPEALKKLMQWLTGFFNTCILCTVLLIASVEMNPSVGLSFLQGISFLADVVSGFGFYIYLGTLAKHLGKSWIVWVGVSVFTNPIGFFVAYFRMKKLVSEEGCKPINPQQQER